MAYEQVSKELEKAGWTRIGGRYGNTWRAPGDPLTGRKWSTLHAYGAMVRQESAKPPAPTPRPRRKKADTGDEA